MDGTWAGRIKTARGGRLWMPGDDAKRQCTSPSGNHFLPVSLARRLSCLVLSVGLLEAGHWPKSRLPASPLSRPAGAPRQPDTGQTRGREGWRVLGAQLSIPRLHPALTLWRLLKQHSKYFVPARAHLLGYSPYQGSNGR